MQDVDAGDEAQEIEFETKVESEAQSGIAAERHAEIRPVGIMLKNEPACPKIPADGVRRHQHPEFGNFVCDMGDE